MFYDVTGNSQGHGKREGFIKKELYSCHILRRVFFKMCIRLNKFDNPSFRKTSQDNPPSF